VVRGVLQVPGVDRTQHTSRCTPPRSWRGAHLAYWRARRCPANPRGASRGAQPRLMGLSTWAALVSLHPTAVVQTASRGLLAWGLVRRRWVWALPGGRPVGPAQRRAAPGFPGGAVPILAPMAQRVRCL
jgi:hypothetical protein